MYIMLAYFGERERESNTYKQSAGIWQGCPLWPYLFVLLMSIVDKDVALNLDTAYQTRNPNKLPVQRICYADDTVLISTNAAAANRLLLNGNNVVKFPDGQKLNRVEETTYLGHQIMPEMDMKHEIQHKMHQTLKTWFKLDTFWKTTICSTRWKLQVYYDIIRNKLLYGLEPYTSRKRNKRK